MICDTGTSIVVAPPEARPHIEQLPENNTRTGFFEREQYEAVLKRLDESLRPVVQFAYITGWRMNDEVLGLEWRQIDMKEAARCGPI